MKFFLVIKTLIQLSQQVDVSNNYCHAFVTAEISGIIFIIRYYAVFNLKLNNGSKTNLLVNKNRFDWSDFEIPCFLVKTGLTGVILKYTFRCNHKSFPGLPVL